MFGEFRDPLTGESIKNKPRRARHIATGQVFIAFSTVDNALWDLRGKLLKQPAYQIMGNAHRDRVPVYWRPGEVGIEPAKAAKMAREAYDRGYRTQKWYFSKGAADGEPGFKANIELVRMLREELPEATLMFDNHTIRHSDDVEYSLRLCKAVAPYKPFWIEEPICPEHLDGYIRDIPARPLSDHLSWKSICSRPGWSLSALLKGMAQSGFNTTSVPDTW